MTGDADAAALEHLAVGFALDELDDAETDRLLEMLKARDATAAEVAHLTWQALRTTMDLRISLNQDFVAVTRERIEDLMHERERKPGLLAGILGKLGFTRPQLKVVHLPGERPRRAARWPWLVGVLAIAVVLGLVLLLVEREPQWVSFEVLRGLASSEGVRFEAGEEADLGARTLNVHAGGRVRLRWDDGSRLTLRGPAQAVPRDAGVSLNSGGGELVAGEAFVLGLPDRRVSLAAGTRLVVEVLPGETLGEMHSLIGVLAGTAATGDDLEITADRCLDDAGRVQAWQQHLQVIENEGKTRVANAIDGDTRWRLEGNFVPRKVDDVLAMIDADGRELHLGTTVVRHRVEPDDEWHERRLTITPLRPRHVVLTHTPGKGTRITFANSPVDLEVELNLPRELTGWDLLRDVAFHTGPDPALGER